MLRLKPNLDWPKAGGQAGVLRSLAINLQHHLHFVNLKALHLDEGPGVVPEIRYILRSNIDLALNRER